jgi:hypothetical protein
MKIPWTPLLLIVTFHLVGVFGLRTIFASNSVGSLYQLTDKTFVAKNVQLPLENSCLYFSQYDEIYVTLTDALKTKFLVICFYHSQKDVANELRFQV